MDRRMLLKGVALGALGGVAFAGDTGKKGEGSLSLIPGVVYTASHPGRWKGKERSHAPSVVVDKQRGKLIVDTPHPMTASHYIVKHLVVDRKGKVIGEKVFSPAGGGKAVSEFDVSVKDLPSEFLAASFCNIHDLWITVVKI